MERAKQGMENLIEKRTAQPVNAVRVWTGKNPIPLQEYRPLNLSGSLAEDVNAITRTLKGGAVAGHLYIKVGIQEAVKDPNLLVSCSRGLFLVVAEKCGTTPKKVGMGMRTWIRGAWARRDESNMALWRIVMMDPDKEVVPTTKCFLTKISEQIRGQYAAAQR